MSTAYSNKVDSSIALLSISPILEKLKAAISFSTCGSKTFSSVWLRSIRLACIKLTRLLSSVRNCFCKNNSIEVRVITKPTIRPTRVVSNLRRILPRTTGDAGLSWVIEWEARVRIFKVVVSGWLLAFHNPIHCIKRILVDLGLNFSQLTLIENNVRTGWRLYGFSDGFIT